MQVIACQLDIAWEDRRANYERVRLLLGAATVEPGALVVLPEMFPTGFSMNVEAVAEPEGGETERFLADTARELGVYVVGGLAVRGADGRPRNQSVTYGPDGELAARYSKLQPFTLGGEADCYAAGAGTCLYTWGGLQVASFVCYDLRFPEIWRRAVGQGAQLYTVIANWPVAREKHWTTLLQARAIENQSYVIGVNRCGKDPKFSYSGRSLIVDPSGAVLADAGNGECTVPAEVDAQTVTEYRRKLPFLQDMRPDFLRQEA
jgi:omega-amidase